MQDKVVPAASEMEELRLVQRRRDGVEWLFFLAEVFSEEGSRESRLSSPEFSSVSRVSLTSPRVPYAEKTLRNQACLPKLPLPVKQHLMSHHLCQQLE